jgi:hypothetical protein
MENVSWIDKLKQRWHLGSSFQVVIVLVVFACTGFTVYFLKKPLLRWITGEEPSSIGTILYYILILPVYNLLLLGYGFIFGQFNFFWNFEKRFIQRITSFLKKQN